MVANGVDIFFQGHDHLYAVEELDGIVYQEVPMPSDSSYNIGVTDNGDAYTGIKLNGSGHLRVRVDPDCVTVDYVAAWLPQTPSEQTKTAKSVILTKKARAPHRQEADIVSTTLFSKYSPTPQGKG
jgi:hypothetical protein